LIIKKIIGSSSNVVGLAMHEIRNIVKKEFGLNLIQIERFVKVDS